jgi:hypothetical protein
MSLFNSHLKYLSLQRTCIKAHSVSECFDTPFYFSQCCPYTVYTLISRSCFILTTRFLGVFAKLRKMTISFVTSVRLHGTTRLPLVGF